MVGAREAVVQIARHSDAELGRRLCDGAEDVPGRDAGAAARAEAHVALAHTVAGAQLGRVVVQGDVRVIRMRQNSESLVVEG